jgi:hypothetical protein
MLTFGEFKCSVNTKNLSGVCVDSPDFVSYTNGAVQQLARRGNWFGTLRSMRACVYDTGVAWPRHVATIFAIKTCNHVMDLYNRWFSFLPMEDCSRYWGEWSGSGAWGNGASWGVGPGFGRRGFTESDGNVPVFNPISCGNQVFLQFVVSDPTDVGKTITVMGIDYNGQVVRTQRPDGTIQEGIVLTLAVPYVQTPFQFRHVTRVVRQATNYPVRGYQVLSSGALLDLCYYEPTEVSPEYVHTHISSRWGRGQNGCIGQVEALVKIKPIPVKHDQDLLLIDNETALANMVMAVRFKEQGDLANARGYEVEAFRELNYQMHNLFPDEQFVVNFRPFGRDGLNNDRVRIGMI